MTEPVPCEHSPWEQVSSLSSAAPHAEVYAAPTSCIIYMAQPFLSWLDCGNEASSPRAGGWPHRASCGSSSRWALHTCIGHGFVPDSKDRFTTSELQPLWWKGSGTVSWLQQQMSSSHMHWSCFVSDSEHWFTTSKVVGGRVPEREGCSVLCVPPADLFTQSYIESGSVSDSKDRFTTSVLQPFWRTGSGKGGLQCVVGPRRLRFSHCHALDQVLFHTPRTGLRHPLSNHFGGRVPVLCRGSPSAELFTHVYVESCFVPNSKHRFTTSFSKWVEESFRKGRTAVCCWSPPPTTRALHTCIWQRFVPNSKDPFTTSNVVGWRVPETEGCSGLWDPPAELFTKSHIGSWTVSDSKDRFTMSVLQPLWRTGSKKGGLQCIVRPGRLSFSRSHTLGHELFQTPRTGLRHLSSNHFEGRVLEREGPTSWAFHNGIGSCSVPHSKLRFTASFL